MATIRALRRFSFVLNVFIKFHLDELINELGQKITRKYSYFYRQNDGLEAKQINPEEKELGLRLKN